LQKHPLKKTTCTKITPKRRRHRKEKVRKRRGENKEE
jgi:hypothetical protein